MTRGEVYRLIDEERDRQNQQRPRNENDPFAKQYNLWAPHLLVLEEKVAGLRALWYGSYREQLVLEVTKIAATAVRALEEVTNKP